MLPVTYVLLQVICCIAGIWSSCALTSPIKYCTASCWWNLRLNSAVEKFLAGTGKTYTLRAIIDSLNASLNMLICAATGLSSIVLSEGLDDHPPATVHSSFGLMDGRLDDCVIMLFHLCTRRLLLHIYQHFHNITSFSCHKTHFYLCG